MRRKGKQKKKGIVKDNEIIAFIDVLIDLFLCKQYCDCVHENHIGHSSRAPQIHIKNICIVIVWGNW